MIIFKDIFTGDEIFSDSYKYSIKDDICYHIVGKFIQQRDDGDYDIGGNPSAEEAAEEVDSNVTTGVDIILAQRLAEIQISKGEFKKEMKKYAGALIKKVAQTDAKRADFLKANLQKIVIEWVKDFDDLLLYRGESYNEDGCIVFVKFREQCDIGSPVDVYVLKDALEEEKC